MPTYNPQDIEPRWQRYWLENKTFRTPDVSEKPKFYILDMFPYPRGAARGPSRRLHRHRHPEPLQANQRRDVLHPMGWDAFGLHGRAYASRRASTRARRRKKTSARFAGKSRCSVSIALGPRSRYTDPHYTSGRTGTAATVKKADLSEPCRYRRRCRQRVRTPSAPIKTASGWRTDRFRSTGASRRNRAGQRGGQGPALQRGNHPVIQMPLRKWPTADHRIRRPTARRPCKWTGPLRSEAMRLDRP